MKTDGSVKVLVDTSAWIAFFRREEPHFSQVSQLIDDGRVACCGVILAELLQGAKSDKETRMLKNFPAVFEFPAERVEAWIAAGELSGELRKSGTTFGLADCYIAVTARDNGYTVMSLDRHFIDLTETTGTTLYSCLGD